LLSLYIDMVMCLESMLDKVTVNAICQKLCFFHCWCIM